MTVKDTIPKEIAEHSTNGVSHGEAQGAIVLDRVPLRRFLVPIIGTAPLIVHRFSEKAKRQMLDAAQGKKTPKTPKDPQAEYEASFHRLPDGRYGFPVIGFKAATVGGGRFYGGVTMTALKQFIFFRGEPSPEGPMAVIEGEPHMREDYVRVGRGGAENRFRGEFSTWSSSLDVTFAASMLSQASVLSLIEAGGLGVGIGEWRPEKGGVYGTYQIDTTKNLVEVEL